MIELRALQGQVRHLVEDLRGQVARSAVLRSGLRREYEEAERAGRVGGTFQTWLEDLLDQAAVAWVLSCVFVRFCEDNRLVEPLWLGGEDPAAPADRAVRNRQGYLIANPRDNDRHWLRNAFEYLRDLSATGRIFDSHNLVWRFDISGEAAEVLSDFFRRGAGRVSLRTEDVDTRFLGELYEHLSVHARTTYALLQTPEFVERFILDRAFEPALAEFGLPNMSVIDPACGSGHFLLGAFDRLVRRWKDREPGTDVRVLVERALGQVTGVDINPAAVAIARFRLMVAALNACGLSSLERAPSFRIRVAAGDSLLPWGDTRTLEQGDLLALVEDRPVFALTTEDEDLLKEFLRPPGRYTLVVGNPPYITVKDEVANKRYRELYPTVCYRQYALSVPFAKRFFDLAKRGDEHGEGAGLVGQITANSFMKREFGKKLINDYFAHEVELTEVIDTSGAYIPGHGTPTVILIGRANKRRRSATARTVLGIRGEPEQPENPARGHVWTAIVDQIDRPGSESQWASVTDLRRAQLATHPWSLSGGGAVGLRDALTEASTAHLSDLVDELGFGAVTREDDAYCLGGGCLRRHRIQERHQRPLVDGETARDWSIDDPSLSLWPYDAESLQAEADENVLRLLWPLERGLAERVAYGSSQLERGLTWFEYSMFFTKRYRVRLSIAWGEVATHNHFVLDRGGKVFNRTAPLMKLPEGASEDDHLRLLGVLNSSAACFWLKQVCFPKGGSGIGRGIQPEDWMERYAFNGSNVQELPLPEAYPLELSRRLDGLAQRLATVTPAAVAESGIPTRDRLKRARDDWHSIRAQMIALQEELDWQVYRLYGLTDEELTTVDPPELDLGQRAFEIVLARTGTDTVWFERHGSTPITELPGHWPAEYRKLVEQRIAVIESDRNIALIERPECKRRWATPGWDSLQADALRSWLLDRLESVWQDSAPMPLSIAQLADRMRHDEDFRAVLDLWVGHDQHDLVRTIGTLVADEHVPYLPADRYKPSGLRKRAQWERTWAQQRRQDAGEDVQPKVPPKYTSTDFLKHGYWRNRGKLDVPKERFISYPGMARDGDGTELLGWAGWDHLAQAQALVTVYLDRKTQSAWPANLLLPLLAGLAELEPWLHQWFAEPRPGYPGTPAEFFTGLLDTELSALGADRPALAKLRGVETFDD